MKQLKLSLKVDKIKQTQYTGGNICVTSCGRYIFCIYGTNVNVIDIETGCTKHSLESEEEEITCICLSPDDKHLITAHKNLLVKQWDNWNQFETNENTIKTTTKCTRTWKAIHTAPIHYMVFDSTSTLLATGSSDYTTKVWDIQAQYCTHNLKGSTGIIRAIVFHPDIHTKQQIITGSEDGKIRVYDLNTSKIDACLEGHFSVVTSLHYVQTSHSHDKLLSSSRDKVLIMWDLINFTKLRTVPVYESIESILIDSSIVANQENRFVITMGNEGLLKIWDLKTSKNVYAQNKLDSLKINKKKSNELDQVINQGLYNSKTNTLFLVTSDQMIVFVRISRELIEKILANNVGSEDEMKGLFDTYKQYIGDHGEILDMQYCDLEEKYLAVATNSEFVKIYDLNTWDCRLLKGHSDLVICLACYMDKKESYLASSSKDNTIRIWKFNFESNTFECILVSQGHSQDVGALAFSRLGLEFLVSGSIDTTIKFWRIKKNDTFKMDAEVTLKAHEKDINSVHVSPNDKLVASGSSDKTVKIWDSATGAALGVLRGHKRGVWCVQFSPIDQLLASSSADSTIKLWSLGDFSCVKTFEGHNTSVLKVYFLNHGTQLISSATDGLIKLWNIKSNECVGTFDEHEDKVWALNVSKDENRFVSGGADGKLIVWKDVTGELYEEELEKREEILLKEQELENYLKEKKWKKALGLAILLNKPFRCYEIIKEILQSDPTEDMSNKNTKGRLDLENTLLKLRDDQIKCLLKYANDWNTNTKFCLIAQIVFELILRNYPPEFVVDNTNSEFAPKLIEQFLPYTERHNARLNKLAQQILFIDFAWQNMKLEDKNIAK